MRNDIIERSACEGTKLGSRNGSSPAAISQPRYGLEIPCSWGWPPFLSFPESGISLHGIHVGLFLLRAYEFIAPLTQTCVEINIFNASLR
nr:MAG TPA: hypothetical protein [Caudoviricetes sp.]